MRLNQGELDTIRVMARSRVHFATANTAMTDTSPRDAPMVRCPTCQTPARFAADNIWRPFCSQRCRGVDLGAWASERFRVAVAPDPDDEAEPLH